MNGAVARATKFIGNVAADIASCPRAADKVAVALADAGRVASVLAESVFGSRVKIGRRPLVFRDVEVVHGDGRFWCRRRTSDYSIVRFDYERTLRPFFELDRGVFVDVGAHIGKYAVLVGRQLGPRGQVVAIEPDPGNFAALRRNIAANSLGNVLALNVACGDTNEERTLHRHPEEPIKHSLRGEGPGIPVQVKTLDALLSSHGIQQVDLLKLDTEGVELEVLNGAVEVLRRSRSIRIVLEAEDERPVAFLRSLGFRLSRTEHSFGTNGWYYIATPRGATPAVG